MRPIATLLAAAVIGLAAGFGLAWLTGALPPDATDVDEGSGVGDRRPDFEHAGIHGNLWRAADFDEKPLLINFWATWCAPCVREMPVLQALAEERAGSLAVVGIAVDEPERVREFVEALGIDYPILVGTTDVSATRRAFGNPGGMLPYTVLIDAAGIIRWQHLGELERADLDRAISRHL